MESDAFTSQCLQIDNIQAVLLEELKRHRDSPVLHSVGCRSAQKTRFLAPSIYPFLKTYIGLISLYYCRHT